jgi:hypothetical protein
MRLFSLNSMAVSLCFWIAACAAGKQTIARTRDAGDGGAGNAATDAATPRFDARIDSARSGSGGEAPVDESVRCDAENYGVLFAKSQCPKDCTGQGSETYISGKVYDPAGKRTIYGAVVYVPKDPSQVVDPLPLGPVQCVTCENSSYAGPPVPRAHAVTAADGSFKIGVNPSTGGAWVGGNPVPVGDDIPLVIQIGKWRRMITVPVTACKDNQIDKSLTSLPHGRGKDGQKGLGSLPSIAVSTGDADMLQCLLVRIGIDIDEFTNPGGGGAVNLFNENYAKPLYDPAPSKGGGTSWPSSRTELWASVDTFKPYDIVLMACNGEESALSPKGTELTDAMKQALVDYTNIGGKIMLEHFHAAWLKKFEPKDPTSLKSGQPCLKKPVCSATIEADLDAGGVCDGNTTAISECQPCSFQCTNLATAPYYAASAPFGEVASWVVPNAQATQGTGITSKIDQSFPSGDAFAKWLIANKGSAQEGTITIESTMKPAAIATIQPPSQRWIYDDSPSPYVHYFTFNTPVGQDSNSQCGRVVYTDVHVTSSEDTKDEKSAFPGSCDATSDLLNQEKAIEFILFDLSHCTIDDSTNINQVILL